MMNRRNFQDHIEKRQNLGTFTYNPNVKLPDSVGKHDCDTDRINLWILSRLARQRLCHTREKSS